MPDVPYSQARSAMREAMRAAGLTQREVARRMGTSEPFVSALLNSGRNPTLRTLSRWAKATGHRLVIRMEADGA